MTQRKPIGFCTDAVENGDLETARRMLIEHNCFATECPHYVDRMLATAAGNNDLVMVQELARLGGSVHWSENGDEGDASEALYRAADKGAIHVARWLIQQGAKCNRRDRADRVLCPALSAAAREGHLELVKLLIENGAAINATWMGRNPLSFAMDKGRSDVVAYLRSQGAKTPDELGQV